MTDETDDEFVTRIESTIDNLCNRADKLDDQIEALKGELIKVVGERDEARRMLFPYADAKEISGISWDGKYLIGDKKSIEYFHEMKNRGEQIDVYKRAFDERIAASEAKLQVSQDMLREALKALKYAEQLVDGEWGNEKIRQAIQSIEATLVDERKEQELKP